ncbi:MAG TPA: flagellar filament capping protein FliD [Solirubrobacteraceae bacterium]|nr:flagellar filament capping protein FliD [Solirubrobacteraceae bacterium]
MSSSSVSGSSGAVGVPINFTGLGSGLDTNAIISALMAQQRQPVERMSAEEARLQAERSQLQSIQTSLQSLSFAAAEFSLPSLFESTQAVSSSNSALVAASASAGAGPGAHEVTVTQLARAAQRAFSFASPSEEQPLSIDGHALTLKAGASVQEFAQAVNSDPEASVYAAVLQSGQVVLSNRATGNTSGEFIQVSDPGGALSEVAGSARDGADAEYNIDGVAGSSTSNTVVDAIPGVTLTLSGLTGSGGNGGVGPVTVLVSPPAPSTSAIQSQLQSFVTLYNTTVAQIQKQLSTKPPTGSQAASEPGVGALFGDSELSGLLTRMRQSMYEPIAGLPAGMASPADVGISTGGPAAGGASQSSLEGQLQLNTATLAAALQSNPAGVKKMLQSWSQSLQSTVDSEAQAGGGLEARIVGEGSEITSLGQQVASMSELLEQRQKALQATYAKLESVISENQSQASWLASQTTSLNASGI